MSRARGGCGFHKVGRGTTSTRNLDGANGLSKPGEFHAQLWAWPPFAPSDFHTRTLADWIGPARDAPSVLIQSSGRSSVYSIWSAVTLALDPTQGRTMRVPR